MSFGIILSSEAQVQFDKLEKNKALRPAFKAVVKALVLLAENPKYPALHTHEYFSLKGPAEAKVFEAYAHNKTPGAYRIFFSYYPPKTNQLYILAITPHP